MFVSVMHAFSDYCILQNFMQKCNNYIGKLEVAIRQHWIVMFSCTTVKETPGVLLLHELPNLPN